MIPPTSNRLPAALLGLIRYARGANEAPASARAAPGRARHERIAAGCAT